MKTLKLNWILPSLVVVFAVTAAFTSVQSKNETSTWEQGYVHTTQPCKKSIQCNTNGLIQCTSNGNLVFAMDGSTGCDRPLYFN